MGVEEENLVILYIDDDRPNLSIFRVLFRKLNVITTTSANEGLEILESNNKIKIVLSDLKMPEMDGLKLIETAKLKFPDIICAIVSGSDLGTRIKKAIEKGTIHDHISKPFDMKMVTEKMKRLIELAH